MQRVAMAPPTSADAGEREGTRFTRVGGRGTAALYHLQRNMRSRSRLLNVSRGSAGARKPFVPCAPPRLTVPDASPDPRYPVSLPPDEYARAQRETARRIAMI